jgi:hypothetical protein
MHPDPSTMARRAPAALRGDVPPRAQAPLRPPRERPRGEDRTVDPADRRRRANAALLELVVERATRHR